MHTEAICFSYVIKSSMIFQSMVDDCLYVAMLSVMTSKSRQITYFLYGFLMYQGVSSDGWESSNGRGNIEAGIWG